MSSFIRPHWSGTSSKRAERAEEFTLWELALATDSFSSRTRSGLGALGSCINWMVVTRDVAIKRGETAPKMETFQEKEGSYHSELAFLSRLHHKNLVRLVGHCEEKDERLLVYEYMKNGSLHDPLHDRNNAEKGNSVLNSWKMRINIVSDTTRGIEYLHNHAIPPIIHRDIKSLNILLDANWTARVFDFGLFLMSPEFNYDHQRPVPAAGTVGYIDPSTMA
ncbi:hypothetical protein CDL15_Pgr022532 [Punica granatum]|uniref:Protein kinase domain-containing protein n=1 Tax=Punica granatum TaxID=22663 RepID=A0A218XSC0_PUNGR|nr:hypothetical protein CDL15_Pgr022532 [Punica granatum]